MSDEENISDGDELEPGSSDISETPEEKREAAKKKVEESAEGGFAANARVILGAAMLAAFIRVVLFEAFEIDGPSMQPSLLNGDRVVVSKMLYGLFLPFTHEAVMTWGQPSRGDIVILNSPADGLDIVKRVIGVGGDTVAMIDGELYVNGESANTREIGECEEEAQMKRPGEPNAPCTVYEQTVDGVTFTISRHPSWRMLDFEETIREGHIWVFGDHRDHSNDSEEIGQIPVSRIKGQALFTYISCGDDPEGWFGCGNPRWDRFFMDVH